jgi:hypothetical protein
MKGSLIFADNFSAEADRLSRDALQYLKKDFSVYQPEFIAESANDVGVNR